ncbi:MAG: heavy-metal-associated domain-containing protein [Solobacterium sp.]|nr:heavy-metal-associated domain-containing protein [Solobacterium sp.]
MATKKTTSKKPAGDRTPKSGKQVRKSKSGGGTAVVFWIVLILFLSPFLVLGYIILSAAMDTGKPIIGNRYDGDHDPAISKSDLERVESSVKSLSGVEKSMVNLATGTVRVYADINDSAGAETAESTAGQVYSTVTSILNESTYFTQSNGKKMYDLEVHVYNQDKNTDSNFVYVIGTKTSSMDAPIYQLVSEPIDAELAESLRQAVENRNNPKPAPTPAEETPQEGEASGEETAEGNQG